MQVREEKLSVFEAGQIGVDRLFDLHDHVRLLIDVVRGGEDLLAVGGVLLIGEAAAIARAGLDVDGVAVRGEVLRARGRHPHAILIVLDLSRYTDPHRFVLRKNVIPARSARRAHSSPERTLHKRCKGVLPTERWRLAGWPGCVSLPA